MFFLRLANKMSVNLHIVSIDLIRLKALEILRALNESWSWLVSSRNIRIIEASGYKKSTIFF